MQGCRHRYSPKYTQGDPYPQEEKPDLQEGVSGRGGRKADVENDEAHRSNPSGRASLFPQGLAEKPVGVRFPYFPRSFLTASSAPFAASPPEVPSFSLAFSRITSYNVCYTKLLRTAGRLSQAHTRCTGPNLMTSLYSCASVARARRNNFV